MSTLALAGLAILFASLLLANLPFLTERYFGIIKPKLGKVKGLGFRLLELLVAYGLSIGCGMLIESQIGQLSPQRWEFYGITVCIFIVLAYPGFVWRYLRKQSAVVVNTSEVNESR